MKHPHIPNIPKRCPACGETSPAAFGSCNDILLDDVEMPCKWVVVRGWYCGGIHETDPKAAVHGTVIRRGPISDDGETEPVDMIETDCVYLARLPGRKIVDMHPSQVCE
jgi:hypothetical protein